MSGFDFVNFLMWYVVFVYSTVCHEAAHAWSALKLGDPTAYHGGQVSLDPTPHVRRELVGMVVVPILSFISAGWILGWASAPYDPQWAERHPRRAGWMALAGPVANLILLLLAALLIRVGMEWGAFVPPSFRDWNISHITQATEGRFFEFSATLLSIIFSLNLLLFTFNLLPLPPFDGSNVPLLFLSVPAAEKYRAFMWTPNARLFGMFIAFYGFSKIFPTIQLSALNLLYPGMRYL
ncbi:MAG: Zn-dependent protease [Chthoniobacteraceae bacterium]|nr:Zn-dependent protease [Chthoniobacteraceae bacterium]